MPGKKNISSMSNVTTVHECVKWLYQCHKWTCVKWLYIPICACSHFREMIGIFPQACKCKIGKFLKKNQHLSKEESTSLNKTRFLLFPVVEPLYLQYICMRGTRKLLLIELVRVLHSHVHCLCLISAFHAFHNAYDSKFFHQHQNLHVFFSSIGSSKSNNK